MINKLCFLLIISISISCNSLKNYDIESEEGIKNTKELIYKVYGKDKEVRSLYLSTSAKFYPESSSEIQSAEISYYENELTYYQKLMFSEEKTKEPRQALAELKNDRGAKSIKINKIDIDQIPSWISEAKRMITNPEIYSSISTGEWRVELNSDSKIIYRFRIYCIYKQPQDKYSYFIAAFEINELGVLKSIN